MKPKTENKSMNMSNDELLLNAWINDIISFMKSKIFDEMINSFENKINCVKYMCFYIFFYFVLKFLFIFAYPIKKYYKYIYVQGSVFVFINEYNHKINRA